MSGTPGVNARVHTINSKNIHIFDLLTCIHLPTRSICDTNTSILRLDSCSLRAMAACTTANVCLVLYYMVVWCGLWHMASCSSMWHAMCRHASVSCVFVRFVSLLADLQCPLSLLLMLEPSECDGSSKELPFIRVGR